MKLSYLDLMTTDPSYNLAMEQYVFDCLPRDRMYFMLWQNDNAIIVGKDQNTSSEINEEAVRERGIRVVRRLSGGGDNDPEALVLCRSGQRFGGGGGAVGRDDPDLGFNAEAPEALHAGAHGVQIAVRPHDNGDFFTHTVQDLLKKHAGHPKRSG